MENFEEKPETLIITEDIRSYIYETAKWTKFLSIVGFILSGLLVVVAFSMSALLSGSMGAAMGPGAAVLAGMGAGFITVLYLLIALMYFYPSLLMFKYARAANKAVLYADQLSLSEAMKKMKSIFKFWGILTIVIISFYLLAILIAIVAGVGAASMAG